MKLYKYGLITLMTLLLAACLRPEAEAPVSVDLRADGQYARANRVPIILFFHSRSCSFCREVEELYLKPLQENNMNPHRFLLRRVETGLRQTLVDFNGNKTDFRTFAQQQKVILVPHLRFFGPDGDRLTADLVGFSSHDFYGGYLEDAINQASEKLRGK